MWVHFLSPKVGGGGGMLDEICGFILWFEALMNRKVMLVADLEKTKFANVYILVI